MNDDLTFSTSQSQEQTPSAPPEQVDQLRQVTNLMDRVRAEIRKTVIGQTDTVNLLLIGLLANGHILLEGPPGTAKTLLTKTFSDALQLNFNRIQFTPDLMPGDVLGTTLFDFKSSQFELKKGPIFTQMLLADEINRTPPKTQAALLQAMQEKSVTLDGGDHDLGEAFMVVATQNPIEQQGTYPLPEAQLDRFLFKHILDWPEEKDEISIVMQHGLVEKSKEKQQKVTPVLTLELLLKVRQLLSTITLDKEIAHYIVKLIRATRTNPYLQYGASSRAASMLSKACLARALLSGRGYVIPDDVKALALPALRHRIGLSPTAELESMTTDMVIEQLLQEVPVPR